MNSTLAITLDFDWAPDWAIIEVAELLIRHRTRASWFVTHQCDALDMLREHKDLFELGIHPNFLPGTTHGDSPQKILAHLKDIVPEAVSMRSHSFYHNMYLLQLAVRDFGIRIDSNVFLPGNRPYIPARYTIQHDIDLLRVPVCWCDDYAIAQYTPCWDRVAIDLKVPGVFTFCFHPLLVALNISAEGDLRRFRGGPLQDSPRNAFAPSETGFCHGVGTQTFFMDLIGADSLAAVVLKSLLSDTIPGE